jgi:hypothetical protein
LTNKLTLVLNEQPPRLLKKEIQRNHIIYCLNHMVDLKKTATDGGDNQFTELKKLCSNLSLLHNQDTKYQTKLQNIEVKLKDMKQQKQQKSKI